MNFALADALPWLRESQSRIRESAAAGRLPHSLLLLSAPGLGVERLAHWTIAFVLCEGAAPRPCGVCAACSLLRSDSHPDAHVVQLEDDAQQIKVDQVRELIGAMSLTSYRGGYKVGLIAGAESLNANGANAFLKTLEEPTQNTLLILAAKPAHRLPATVASRCLRLKLRPPASALAREWLREHAPACADWGPALELAGGAPLLAVEIQASGLGEIEAEMHESMRQLAANAVDVTLLAEHWVKSNAALRLTWLENWITSRLRLELGAAHTLQTAEPVRLPGALLKPKIQNLFGLLDAVRGLMRLSSTGINQQLALEALLLLGRAALAS
jgi:DNA polymerase III subunit delta'